MPHLTLLHRDLSRRIESLRQIVEASQSGWAPTACCSGPPAAPHRHPHSRHTPSHHAPRGGAADVHSIDLNPNTSQLILRCVTTPTAAAQPRGRAEGATGAATPGTPSAHRGEPLDEGFESDVDTISLVSTESAISLVTKGRERESDSANGSASSDTSDSDDSDGKTRPQHQQPPPADAAVSSVKAADRDVAGMAEHFSLVNCVCYTDAAHPTVLILVVSHPTPPVREEETLIFRFESARQLEAFHENFSTVKAVAAQRSAASATCRPFNLLQRTDADGMTHIRISRQEEAAECAEQRAEVEAEFASLLSLPNLPAQAPGRPRYEKFATVGKPLRKRILNKSQSIEDLLECEKPVRKVWNSAENLLDAHLGEAAKPSAPPRRGRQKGPAPLPPGAPGIHAPPERRQPEHTAQSETPRFDVRSVSKSFADLRLEDEHRGLGMGNVFQGQFVRVQVDHTRRAYPNVPVPANFLPKAAPETITCEASDTWRVKSPARGRAFDAFKFSDPKNVAGYHLHKDTLCRAFGNAANREKPKECERRGSDKPRGFAALKLYIPLYKSAKAKHQQHQQSVPSLSLPFQSEAHIPPPTGNFTNRLFGMSSKLKEFGSLQSSCNPDRRYTEQPHPAHAHAQDGGHYAQHNPYAQSTQAQSHGGRTLGRLGRFGRSGSLGNLMLLAQDEKRQCSTLKSVIKTRSKDEDGGKRAASGRRGKKVTFSAYNTVQVV